MTISVSNLGKRFNREWIFNGLTTEFKAGNIYAIVGPNGSGKSTLMKVLWGQVPASTGSINYYIDGRPIPEEEIYQHVTIAAPYMDLIEEFTLQEQVAFHLKFKVPTANQSPADIITKLGLGFASGKRIGQFSSGMKQRLKLGLAFVSQSQALFLDEPTTNLDFESAQWYLSNLMEIRAKKLVFVATNQPTDYPDGSEVINLSSLKLVTKTYI